MDYYLDNNDRFYGERRNVAEVYRNDFESDTSHYTCGLPPISGNGSICVDPDKRVSQEFPVPIKKGDAQWIRASATFLSPGIDPELWRSPQFVIRLFQGDEVVKTRIIRPHRKLVPGEPYRTFNDLRIPRSKSFDKAIVYFHSIESYHPLQVDDLVIELFDE